MKQEQIYKKDINRTIDGVIKADSTTKLKEEITEYVITQVSQVKKRCKKNCIKNAKSLA